MKRASVKDAEGSTVTSATVGTLSQSAYQQLREKLLSSAPPKKASTCSPEFRKQKAREAMKKKRITKREVEAALNVYRPLP